MQDLRPTIAADTHPMLAELLQRCWQKDPALRPTFAEIVDILNSIKEVCSHRTTCVSPVILFYFILFYFILFCSMIFFTRFIARWFRVLCITRGIQVDLTPGGDEAVDAPVLCSVARPLHFLFVVEWWLQNTARIVYYVHSERFSYNFF